MDYLLILLIIFVSLGLIAARLKPQPENSSSRVSYEPRRALFSAAERSFLGVLEQAVAGHFRIMGKVRLGDLIQPAKGLSRSQRTGAWNRIHQKHVDFVLCHPDTLDVAGVVELDDVSHRRKDRSERDAFVDNALSMAGIPIVHFAARKGYSVQEITVKLEQVFSRRAEVEAVKSTGVVSENNPPLERSVAPDEDMTTEVLFAEIPPDPVSGQVVPFCTVCNSPMVKRQAKKGPHAGKYFWACSAFPKCRNIQILS